jgi:[glutamine synthetase] adenylyltransferase / [glutamine synthetase]-adenylyl-L-tyrosine phosphorylase
VLRLCLDKRFAAPDAPRALKDLLARASEMPDFASLEATLRETLVAVQEAFERIVA